MTDRVLATRVESRDHPSSDSGDGFHGFLANRSSYTLSERKQALLASAKSRRHRLIRTLAGAVFFSGGILLGSGLTLLIQGRQPAGQPGGLVVAGLSVAGAGFFALRRPRFASAGPSSSPA